MSKPGLIYYVNLVQRAEAAARELDWACEERGAILLACRWCYDLNTLEQVMNRHLGRRCWDIEFRAMMVLRYKELIDKMAPGARNQWPKTRNDQLDGDTPMRRVLRRRQQDLVLVVSTLEQAVA